MDACAKPSSARSASPDKRMRSQLRRCECILHNTAHANCSSSIAHSRSYPGVSVATEAKQRCANWEAKGSYTPVLDSDLRDRGCLERQCSFCLRSSQCRSVPADELGRRNVRGVVLALQSQARRRQADTPARHEAATGGRRSLDIPEELRPGLASSTNSIPR